MWIGQTLAVNHSWLSAEIRESSEHEFQHPLSLCVKEKIKRNTVSAGTVHFARYTMESPVVSTCLPEVSLQACNFSLDQLFFFFFSVLPLKK